MAVEIQRDLADPERGVTLRNGASVRVRAIRPDDEPRLMALCRRLSPRTVYERFFSFRPLLPEQAHAFANVDYRQRMAIVAEVDDRREPELVGVARYGPSDEGTADIGLVVADAWQGLGLGSLLLQEILHAGEQRGIHEFSAEVLTDNRRALSLFARHTTHAADGGQRRHQRGAHSPCGCSRRGHETGRLIACASRCSDRS